MKYFEALEHAPRVFIESIEATWLSYRTYIRNQSNNPDNTHIGHTTFSLSNEKFHIIQLSTSSFLQPTLYLAPLCLNVAPSTVFPPTSSSPPWFLAYPSLCASGAPTPPFAKSPTLYSLPVAGLMSPPSSRGTSRLFEAPVPYVTVEPGNLVVTDSSMPESRAEGKN